MNLIEIPKLVDRNITIDYPRKIPYIFMQNSPENFLAPSIAKKYSGNDRTQFRIYLYVF